MPTPDTQDTSSNGTPGSEDESTINGADQALKEAENSILDVLEQVKDATRRSRRRGRTKTGLKSSGSMQGSL